MSVVPSAASDEEEEVSASAAATVAALLLAGAAARRKEELMAAAERGTTMPRSSRVGASRTMQRVIILTDKASVLCVWWIADVSSILCALHSSVPAVGW